MQKTGENTIWCEKYRPKTLDTFIGNDHIKTKVEGYLQTGDLPHLLFYGKAGGGKTTLAKIITGNIDCDKLYINASDENNIETVRSKIKGFASSVGFSPIKIIILDECLDENTLIWVLRNGKEIEIPIRDVDEKNDLVKSWNIKKEKVEWRPFYLWCKGNQEIYEIELENGEIVNCTADHKWYVNDKNRNVIVVKTIKLDKYKYILSPQKELKTLKKIQIKSIKKLNESRKVYDLSVKGNHNFFIGKTQILTHNCDYLTPNAQAALRNLMETYSQTTRFILTCNFHEKIIDPIISRCQTFHVYPPEKKEIAIHLATILSQENVTYVPDDVAKIINAGYPDIRKIINTAQRNTINGQLTIGHEATIESDFKSKLVEILKQNITKKEMFEKVRLFLSKNKVSEFGEVYQYFFHSVEEIAPNNVANFILLLNEALDFDSRVLDKEINFMSFLIKVIQLIKEN